jgi:copper chaperone
MNQLEVENIKCSGCANTIEQSLGKLENVETVAVDIDSGIIKITGEADRETIVHKLYELGYPEKGNNSILCKARSYVSCTIGKIT